MDYHSEIRRCDREIAECMAYDGPDKFGALWGELDWRVERELLRKMAGMPKPYYEADGITIYHGDCREILPHLSPVDLIVTDPPYGIGEAAGKNKSRTKLAVAKDYGNAKWDNQTPPEWVFGLMRSMSRYQIIFGGNYFLLPPSSCWLVWDKINGDNDFADCELAWTNFPKAVRRIRWMWAGMLQQDMAHKEFRSHPTQKPVPVMKWAISQAPDGCRSLCDPFMGVGTTLVAAKQLGIRAVGIEIEEKYCSLAVDRLSQSVLDLTTPESDFSTDSTPQSNPVLIGLEDAQYPWSTGLESVGSKDERSRNGDNG